MIRLVRRMVPRAACLFLGVFALLLPVSLSSQPRGAHSSAGASPANAGCASFAENFAEGGGSANASTRGTGGLVASDFDRSVSPCTDFYKFADGGWLKNNPIPPDRPNWGALDVVRQHNEDILHQILEEAAKDPAKGGDPNWQKIGDFYASCMDESQIESAGLKPLESQLQQIAAIQDTAGLQAEIARLQKNGVNAVFLFTSEQDLKDSTQVIAGAGQGGLGLPDRSYYLDEDDRAKQLRTGYVEHMTKMFVLMGDSDATAAAEAKAVMELETTLAKSSKKREDLRDPEANFHVMTLAQLDTLTPHLSWKGYFQEAGVPSLTSADIGQPDFFKEFDAAVVSVPLADWKVYLRWHLIHRAAPSLSAKFVDENFNFYGRALTGVKQNLPRWRRCVQRTDAELGEALGQYYVKRNFPPEAKARALEMVKNLMAALRADLGTLDWMSPATREAAIKKLNAFTLKIGYPDKWRDYSAFHVDRTSYIGNILRGDAFEFARDMNKIGKPVDRTEWDMSPPTVNAYYNPSMNEIVFPAGILQPPFYEAKADDALNYGAIGAVIGHEMTHGFDDEGAKFDGQGNLSNWWTPEDLKNFEQRGECIAKQFGSYEVEPGLFGNGKLEEGESIADLGGITLAHAAFNTTAEAKSSKQIDGFTPEQRFFIAWARVWSENYRPERMRLIVKTDPHPLDQYRANSPLMNTPAFAKAFNCGADSTMTRPEAIRCRIW
jgi:putative endopeptidase